MGGGASSVARYSLKVSNVPPKLTSSASQPLLEQHRKPTLKRSNSDPKVLTDNTIFSPYVDLNIGHRGSAKVIQRAISQSKSTLIGEGKLDYKRSDFYELSSKYPWLLKNAHFVQPQLRDFIVGRIIGEYLNIQSIHHVSPRSGMNQVMVASPKYTSPARVATSILHSRSTRKVKSFVARTSIIFSASVKPSMKSTIPSA